MGTTQKLIIHKKARHILGIWDVVMEGEKKGFPVRMIIFKLDGNSLSIMWAK